MEAEAVHQAEVTYRSNARRYRLNKKQTEQYVKEQLELFYIKYKINRP